MPIKDWDSNPDNNNDSPPLGAPEGGTLISELNNIDRQIMADVREQLVEDHGFVNWGYEATRTGDTTFVINGETVANLFPTGQKIRVTFTPDSYHTVQSASEGGGNTTVTVDGTLPAFTTGQVISHALPEPATPSGVYKMTETYSQAEADALLDDKQDLVPTATEDNYAVFDAAGQVKDGGTPVVEFGGIVEKDGTVSQSFGSPSFTASYSNGTMTVTFDTPVADASKLLFTSTPYKLSADPTCLLNVQEITVNGFNMRMFNNAGSATAIGFHFICRILP